MLCFSLLSLSRAFGCAGMAQQLQSLWAWTLQNVSEPVLFVWFTLAFTAFVFHAHGYAYTLLDTGRAPPSLLKTKLQPDKFPSPQVRAWHSIVLAHVHDFVLCSCGALQEVKRVLVSQIVQTLTIVLPAFYAVYLISELGYGATCHVL